MANRLLLGRRNDGTYGLDISKPTFDVLTANLRDLQFSTKWGHSGSIHQQGTIFYTDGATVTFPEMAYAPLITVAPLYGGVTNFRAYNEPLSGYDSNQYYIAAPLIYSTNVAFVVRDNPFPGITVPAVDFYYTVWRIPGGGSGDI